MSLLARLAWRNVWRHARRSVVTIAAMTLSLWVAILYSGLVEGWMRGMEDDVLDMQLGDLQIHAEGYVDHPSVWTDMTDASEVVRTLNANGLRAAPRSMSGGIAAHDEASAGVLLRGVDPALEATVSKLSASIGQGRWLAADDPRGVVIGYQLQRMLDVDVGDEIVVLTQGRDGSMANDLYTLRGVLGGTAGASDRSSITMTRTAFEELLVMPEGAAHEIVVRRPDEMPLEDAAVLARSLTTHEVQTWRELMPIVATMIDSGRQMVFFIFFVMYLAVGILMLNAMLMAVFERIRELGVMKALGMGPVQVFAVVMLEVFVQLGLALAIAGVLAIPSGIAIATWGIPLTGLGSVSVMGVTIDTSMRGVYSAAIVTPPIVTILFVVGTAALWPALRAARLHPVDAMRHR